MKTSSQQLRRWLVAGTTLQSILAPAAYVAMIAAPAPTVQAQTTGETGAVRGTVMNSATGRYLLNARITVVGTNNFAFTNEFGEFSLPQVPAGKYTLRVYYTGLESTEVQVEIEAGEILPLTVTLRPSAGASAVASDEIYELEAFVVSSRDASADALALNEQRFSANIKNVVSTDAYGEVSQGNIGEFMKHMPGVTIEYNGNVAQGVQIRGFNSNFTNVTIDGGQVASAAGNGTQNHTRSFGLDQASINNISRIEVTKLPTPSTSANSLGGSVNR